MNRSLISRGKTVDEAIDQGLSILRKTVDDVEVEILDNGKKGVLFFGHRDAIVKLTVLHMESSNEISADHSEDTSFTYNSNDDDLSSLEELVDQLDEQDWMSKSNREQTTPTKSQPESDDDLLGVKNGTFYIKDHLEFYPMIDANAEGVTVYKNGKQIKDTTIVSSSDEITFELEKYETSMDWSIDVTPDAIQAICKVKPSVITEYQLLDQADNRFLEIKTEKVDSRANFLEPEDIVNRLHELKISHGLDHAEIVKASESLEEAEFVVAKGKAPEPGESGYLDFKIDIHGQEGKPKLNEDGTVDFRETKSIPSVSQGDIIAKIHPPIPGISGKNVYGDVTPPPNAHEAVVKAGKGIDIVGNQVVALDSGKPQVQTRGLLYQIQVLPTLVHRTDVSIETGNIHFTCDVEIWGSVQEEMTVKAAGDATISGHVDHGKITAGNSIYVKKNTINSHLSAGEGNLVISELSYTIEELSIELKQMLMAVRQLLKAKAFKSSDLDSQGIYSLLNILLDKKFKDIPMKIKTYRGKVHEHREILDEEWLDLAEQLKTLVRPVPNRLITSPEEIETIIEDVDRLYQISCNPPEPNSEIVIANVMNSTVYCSGDISIIGDGSYHTDIHAGGKLEIGGIVRGGDIYAQLGIYVGEIGSKGGMKTYLTVPADQTIKMDYVWEDTVIQIGHVKYRFTDNRQFVKAKLEEDEIVFT
ncbi:uncharacterized protein (DUF342 family) [Alkalibacillus flavidus]|uniref:Uncharacterized protein (DUF342 family) n=1 Tax=Alkalibacillus flavidus TaxID=546021 RepID=A0ABV2KVI3_9BACI